MSAAVRPAASVIAQYTIAWLALAILAIVNGTIREYVYGPLVAELTAHQLSTMTAVLITGCFVVWLQRYWPIQSTIQAWAIGTIWLALTIAFEFGFGHYVAGHAWSRLLAEYDLLAGRVWGLFLLWIMVLPYVAHSYNRRTAWFGMIRALGAHETPEDA